MAEANRAVPDSPHHIFDSILVLDFGSQTSQLITRRLRELHVYSELLPCTHKLSELSWKPKGIILSGGPYSVYEVGAPHVDPAVFEIGVPILGICYGLQEIAWQHGKAVLAGVKREYGKAALKIKRHETTAFHINQLFNGLDDNMIVWMSHGDKLSHLPPGFLTIASTTNAPFAGVAHDTKPYFGIQFHPEVTHTQRGAELLKNFAIDICKAEANWTMNAFVDQEVDRIRALVGENGQVIGAVSGGVDSSVASKLMQKAIGDRYHAVLVDNGLMRLNEARDVKETLDKEFDINLTVVDAADRFHTALKGITDNPEKKRVAIGHLFVDIFVEEAKKIEAAAASSPEAGNIEWLLQGTLYPDVIESISFKGPSATIKTHHNVGGLGDKLSLKLIEPLRELFKDEVRELGTQLGIPDALVWRQPFPGPGLGVRIVGTEVNKATCRIVQEADAIFMEEIRKAGLYRKISQAYVALLGVPVVGVAGDKRVHTCPVVLRAVTTNDFMTADWFSFDSGFLRNISTRITNEVDGVSRVFYDITSKPPGTIEME